MGRRDFNVQVSGPPPMPAEGGSYRPVPETYVCPVCKGRKHLYVGGRWVGKDQPCPTCNGTGVLVRTRYEFVRAGQFLPPNFVVVGSRVRKRRSKWAILASAITVVAVLLLLWYLHYAVVYWLHSP
jgi:hypothetical protein